MGHQKKTLENKGLSPTGTVIEPRGNRYGVTGKAESQSRFVAGFLLFILLRLRDSRLTACCYEHGTLHYRSKYSLDLGFVINDILEHFTVSFGELLEFLAALEVSYANHLNRADHIKYCLFFFCGQLTLAIVS